MEVKFNKVSYIYNHNTPFSKIGLDNVDAYFEKGKIHGITGISGSGKTTMIELIDALMIPSEGVINVGNSTISKTKIVKKVNNLRHKIGLVFQIPEDQFFCDTVEKEISFGIKCFNKNKKDVSKHVKDSLLMVGLDESYLSKDPFSLSSGEMRKIAIASVLAYNPQLIILDEPTICLDEKSKDNLIKMIKMLKNRYKKTLIIVSTDTDLLLKICDDVTVLSKGKVVLTGSKYDVFKQDIEKYGLKKPKIIEFEQLVLKEKGIRIGYRDEINDLMKDIYRNVT